MKIKTRERKFSKALWVLMIGALFFAGVGTGETRDMTPSQAFAITDLSIRSLDAVIQSRGIKLPERRNIPEKGLKPMHTYQMAVSCTDMIIEFEKKLGMRPMPKVVAIPREYVPEDIIRFGLMLLAEIRNIASALKIGSLPETEDVFSDKVPTDVFENVLNIFIRLGILTGMENISPDEVFPQMLRAVSDVKSILIHIDPAQRFRIDSPPSPPEISPSHVFRECLQIRRDINSLRKHLDLETIPVPDIPEDRYLHPADVFVQTQIIIAELNLLKMGTGTVSSTPLAIPVSGKVSRDVHQQALMIRYLLSQILPLQEMVKKMRSEK